MQKFVFLSVFVIAASKAYNFNDGAFNELILENFFDLNNELQEPDRFRFKRDLEQSTEDVCKGRKPRRGYKCCNDSINPEPFQELRDLQKKCFKEIRGENEDLQLDLFSCEKLDEHKIQIVCINECVAQKLGVLDHNGNIKRDAVIEALKSRFSEPLAEWKLDLTEKITDMCLEEIEQDSDSQSAKCNPYILKFAHCVWREYEKACPKNLQIETRKCTKLRQKLENGDDEKNRGVFLRNVPLPEEEK